MAKKKEEQIIDVRDTYTRVESWINSNQKLLSGVAIGLLVLVAAFAYVKRVYLPEKEKEAANDIYIAQQYFQMDSFKLALQGDGESFGLEDVIEDYKFTKTANLAKYYAGMSYLQLGDYDEAIDYLSKFKSKDMFVKPMAIGAIGDAHAEQGDMGKALSFYEKAASHNKNTLTTPLFLKKAAMLNEVEGNYDKALKLYSRLKNEYPESTEAEQIDKYIARVEVLN